MGFHIQCPDCRICTMGGRRYHEIAERSLRKKTNMPPLWSLAVELYQNNLLQTQYTRSKGTQMKPSRNPIEIDALRGRILNSALDIIASVGMEGLTMRKLASKLRMTAPNLYNYFSGKDEIYISIVIRGFEMLHADVKAAHDQNADPAVRIRAMIDAYMQFGMNHPQYYDIMFTRPTPKYEDYRNTPHEPLSAVEYRISMEIADMAVNATASLTGEPAESETVQRRVVEIWSLMHGMLTLSHSRVVQYVINPAEQVYQTIIDEYFKKLSQV